MGYKDKDKRKEAVKEEEVAKRFVSLPDVPSPTFASLKIEDGLAYTYDKMEGGP